ncbi:hypothetical protein PV367_27075 [Streptomyces europaeiscabiei]|uniref:Uncharacterized protein n=1 Tax=Streptomyces europaeiscabiei TaxID=146819 RepID=A0AAJ2PU17_9ACTN|nr:MULTISPECIES: hypothetical protein [Streptomyces]KFF95996.1 hypothetical protein IQ62_39030 [Streptomyces scabiei]MDX3133359.1 hypothetical protein [Streptomyces europaeiscabiei]
MARHRDRGQGHGWGAGEGEGGDHGRAEARPDQGQYACTQHRAATDSDVANVREYLLCTRADLA